MPELSQDAIRELRQSLPLLKRLSRTVTDYSEAKIPIPQHEIQQLQDAYDRVSRLTSPVDVKTWVGDKSLIAKLEELEHQTIWNEPFTEIVLNPNALRQNRLIHSYAERLVLYVQGILEDEEAEQMLNRLIQENTSLKEQLAELRKRELNYLSIIKGDIPHSVSASYQTERRILESNLHDLREKDAMYGLIDTPLWIQNSIREHEKRINEIDAYIARSKASKIDWI